jgi:hypothetical protein
MPRFINRDIAIPPGSVVVSEWLLADLIDTMTRSVLAHEWVSKTYPSEIVKAPAAWGARMGESTICAAYLRCALDQLQALKDEQ